MYQVIVGMICCDVRGDRGTKIISCFSDTGQTQGVKACTNI